MLQPRLQWGKLIQFISGHNYVNMHDFLCYGAEDEAYNPMCTLCDSNELQIPAHLISQCPYFLGNCIEIFREFILNPPLLLPISKILRFLHQSELEALRGAEEVVHNTTT